MTGVGFVVLIGLGAGLAAAPVGARRSPPALGGLQERIRAAIAAVRPAVVSITAFRAAGEREAETVAYRSIGSGVIIDPRGYVLTNGHVVRGASRVQVALWRAEPTELWAQWVEPSQERDLALLKLEGPGPYPFVDLADGSAAQAGDWVLALGSPFGLEHSVSLGIVGHNSRDLAIGGVSYRGLVQTDAAINQGNSGGPLIDLEGRLLGINTAIYAPTGDFTGIGFAIPTAQVRDFCRGRLSENVQLAAAQVAEPIRPGEPAPHRPLGPCGNCHTFLKPSAGPPLRTIAATGPGAPRSLATVPAPRFRGGNLIWAAGVLVVTGAYCLWMSSRTRAGQIASDDGRMP